MIEKNIEYIQHLRDVFKVSMKYGLGHMRYVPRNKDIVGTIQGVGGPGVARVIMKDLKLSEEFMSLILSDRNIEEMGAFKNLIRKEDYEEILKEQEIKDK